MMKHRSCVAMAACAAAFVGSSGPAWGIAEILLVPAGADPANYSTRIHVPPGELLTIEVFVKNTGVDLGNYVVEMTCSAIMGGNGYIAYAPGSVEVDTLRPDYVFAGLPSVPACNDPGGGADCCIPAEPKCGAASLFGGALVGSTPKYLAEFTYKVSGDAGEQFSLFMLQGPNETYLRDTFAAIIPYNPAPLWIIPTPRRFADVAPCGGDGFPNMMDVFAAFNTFNASSPCPDPGGHDCCKDPIGVDQPSCINLDVAACVCAVDPFCCSIDWDDLCADKVESEGCGVCPPCP